MELSGAHAAARGVHSLAALSARWVDPHGGGDAQAHAPRNGEPSCMPTGPELACQRDIDQASSVHDAMREGRVRAVLQPICEAGAPDKVFYYECLARISARDSGASVAHQMRIGSLEKLGLMRAFDRDMTQRAIRLLAQDAQLVLGVNISAGSAVEDAWWHSTFAQLAASPLVARRLIVEITETARPMPGHCRRFSTKLRQLGCRVGVDDFGASHSDDTLAALGGSDFVKIAGPLVTGAKHSAQGRAALMEVIAAAQKHARLFIVEHVEDEQALLMARHIGAPFVQGFHVGRPLELATLFHGR
ncbi:EAL domain-containing protein [Pandoraea oxalativorans]|nr:EAL domain-containing protein [Pandoraea oxalativorans]